MYIYTMKKEETIGVTPQGSDPKPNNQEEKKVQLSIKMLKHLAGDNELLKIFLDTLVNNTDMKAPIAYQFAIAIQRQTKIFAE